MKDCWRNHKVMKDDTSYILQSYYINEEGHHTALNHDDIADYLEDETLAWVHLEGTDDRTQPWLDAELAYLDPYIVKSLLAVSTRPSMTAIGDGALINLRGVNLDEEASPEDMVSIRLWVDAHRIISVQRRHLEAVDDIAHVLMRRNSIKNAGDFICAMINKLFERLDPIIIELGDKTDTIEEALVQNSRTISREDIVNVRIQAIMFRRHLAPQREAIMQLRSSDLLWIEDSHRRSLQELYSQVTRYLEDLDAIRERAQIIKDELTNQLSSRLNRNLYVLSVISAIFLPLTFLTGLFGINIGGMPGVDSGYAFWIFSGALFILLGVQITLFKWFRWF
jgi:zinc transporter